MTDLNILLSNIIKEEFNKLGLKEKMIKFLVTKKHRGTYQAMLECDNLEKELSDQLLAYLLNWTISDICTGDFRKLIVREFITQLFSELSGKGFREILD